MFPRSQSAPRFIFALALLILLAASVWAQEFSAEFVSNEKDSSGPSKIYVGKDKMRIEGHERGGEGPMGPGALIMDFANHKTYILMPQQKMYMESMPGKGPQQSHMWFRPNDVNNACPDFEEMVRKSNKSITCHKVGPDTVNGRPAIKYEGSSDNGTGYVWIDQRLRFVSKWQDKNGGGELRNIHEGAQDATLFEVPPDYHKFDMQEMMRQRQQRPQ